MYSRLICSPRAGLTAPHARSMPGYVARRPSPFVGLLYFLLDGLGIISFIASIIVLCLLAEPGPQISSFAPQTHSAHRAAAADPIGDFIRGAR